MSVFGFKKCVKANYYLCFRRCVEAQCLETWGAQAPTGTLPHDEGQAGRQRLQSHTVLHSKSD